VVFFLCAVRESITGVHQVGKLGVYILVIVGFILTLTLSPNAVAKPAHRGTHIDAQNLARLQKSFDQAGSGLAAKGKGTVQTDLRVGGQTRSSLERRASTLTCELSAFFSMDPAEQVGVEVTLDGRGLMTCRNDQGFSTEFPVMADLGVLVPKGTVQTSEFTLSANSESFIIPQDISQLQDTYSIHSATAENADRATPTHLSLAPGAAAFNQPLRLDGKNHELVIELRLTTRSQPISGLRVTTLNIRFDDSAPDLIAASN
jgi:hypothetical protein